MKELIGEGTLLELLGVLLLLIHLPSKTVCLLLCPSLSPSC